MVSRLELRSTVISSAIEPINHTLRRFLGGFSDAHEGRGVCATRGASPLSDFVSLSCTSVFSAGISKDASCTGWRSRTIVGPDDEKLLAGAELVDVVNSSASVNDLT